MEMENNQPITPTKRVVEVLIDENGNPKEGEVVKKVLTFETLDLPTLDEVVGKTEPDYDDFEVLRGKMGACDELTEFTKVFYYKEKVDPPVNGKDYCIKQLPKYPKFLALFEGKETINDITLFDVNRMFNEEQFEEALEEDDRKNALADAAAEIHVFPAVVAVKQRAFAAIHRNAVSPVGGHYVLFVKPLYIRHGDPSPRRPS